MTLMIFSLFFIYIYIVSVEWVFVIISRLLVILDIQDFALRPTEYRTESGKLIRADLLIKCTGVRVNSDMFRQHFADWISERLEKYKIIKLIIF